MMESTRAKDNFERINGDTFSVQEFIEKYEKPGIPVVITELTKNWSANQNWTEEVGWVLFDDHYCFFDFFIFFFCFFFSHIYIYIYIYICIYMWIYIYICLFRSSSKDTVDKDSNVVKTMKDTLLK